MKRAGAVLGGVAKISTWSLIAILFLSLQQLGWDKGGVSSVGSSLAAGNPDQAPGDDAGDSTDGDSGQGNEGDDTSGSGDTDDADPGDVSDDDEAEDADEADGADDSGDSDDADDDRGGQGDGEDALDSLADDGDNDDDSEPEEIVGICDEKMSSQIRMSIDGLCSISVGTKIKRRLGYLSELTLVQPETVAGGSGKVSTDASKEVDLQKESAATPAREQYVPLPEYEEGEVYVYSDGSWEQVVAANHERVEWQNHYGNRSVGFPDFTYKRNEWQTSTRAGVRRFTQTSYLFDEPTTTLWPLTTESKTRYDEKGKWIGKDGIERVYDSFWRCDVEGQERVQVAAGEFDTWRICCSRYRDSYSFPKSRAREYKTWYYAPSVEHWVLMTRDNRGLRPDTRKELVAIIPDLQKITRSPQALVQVQQQFQEVLETTAENQSDLWIAAAGDTVVTMTPGPVFAGENGVICRQYTQEVEAAEMSKRYPGIGCRTPDGTWYIPRR